MRLATAACLTLPLLAALGACSGRSGYTPTSTSPQDNLGDDDDTPFVTPDAAVSSDASDASSAVDAEAGLGASSSSSSTSSSSGASPEGGGGGGGVQAENPDPSTY